MTELSKHAPAANGPATAASDPYATVHAPLIEPVPKPGEPGDGSTTSLTIHVPAEGTTVDLGAGPTPGIRMETAHHVHMTAGDPKTTISLGAQGGDASECAGISMYTLGEEKIYVALAKEEHIVGHVETTYDAGEKKEITGKLEKHVSGGIAEYKYDQKLGIESGPREEKVHGDWEAKIDGTVDWKAGAKMEFHAFSDHIFNIEGMAHKQVVGLSTEVLIGGENTQIIGQKTEILVGGEMKTVIGPTVDICLAHVFKAEAGGETEIKPLQKKMEALCDKLHAIEKKAVAAAKKDYGAAKKAIGVELKQLGAEIKKAGPVLHDAAVKISSAAATIIK
jgi:hypothetical protein